LKQVFVNLVWNAIDAMESTAIRRLSIGLRVQGAVATLSCSDTGPGIPPDMLLRIFDPFFTTKEPSRGTGLGLSVCLAIVKQLGGDIRVQSTIGVGTTFHVILPIADHESAAAKKKSFSIERSTPVEGRGRRVLVVDDEEPVAELVARALSARLGCVVEQARNGREATAALERAPYDVVLSDMDQLLAWLSAHRPALVGRTVFMTGDGHAADPHTQIEAAGRPILRKPFSVEALLTATRGVLADYPAATSAAE
jgi:CheY-like chemotaxis protein